MQEDPEPERQNPSTGRSLPKEVIQWHDEKSRYEDGMARNRDVADLEAEGLASSATMVVAGPK